MAEGRRPIEPIDTHAPVSLARQFLAERDTPGNVMDKRACDIIRQLLKWMDASVDRAHGPLAFDRNLVADMLRNPLKYRGDAVSNQAALVQGTLGEDTPMANPPLVQMPRRRQVDEE